MPLSRRRVVALLLILLALVPLRPSASAARPLPPTALRQQTNLPLTYLKASNTDPQDLLQSVAIDGDTLVMGAPYEDSAAAEINGDQQDNTLSGAGAAYVMVRTGSRWMQQAYLKPTTPQAGARFGSQVAILGDTIVVAAPAESLGSLLEVGAVYVFVRTGTTWTQQARLTPPTLYDYEVFGLRLALAADRLVVANSGEGAGVESIVQTFARVGQTWTRQEPLALPTAPSSLAMTSQWLVVGNEVEDGTGVVHVYQWDGTAWQHHSRLTAANADHDDRFGRSVAIGPAGIVIGAPSERSASTGVNGDPTDNSLIVAGAAYVFGWTGNEWEQQAYLKASNPDVWDSFGATVATSGDWIVIGAPYEASSATGTNGPQEDNRLAYAGAAYLFHHTGDTWQQWFYQKAATTGPYLFGSSLAMSGDTMAIGASNEASCARGVDGDGTNTGCTNAGAVYAVRLTSVPNLGVRWYGQAVSLGDGTPTLPTRLGITAPGQPITRTFTLDNQGSSPLGLTDTPPVAIAGDPAFRIVTQPATELAPFSSTAVQVQFAPTTTGVATATLQIPSTDPDVPQTDLVITGIATDQPPLWLPLVGLRSGR